MAENKKCSKTTPHDAHAWWQKGKNLAYWCEGIKKT